jgi:RhtB (resistance to homoserine/threonine) family protein
VLAFAAFAAVLTITPGLDTMLVLRTSAVTGRRAGLAAVAGIAVGCLVWAVASALGVAAVLATSRLAFEILRTAGVVYLVWLGVRALWHARGAMAPPVAIAQPAGPPRPVGIARAFRTGLTSNLLNPKAGAFYLSVMPQFLPDGLNPLAGALALGAIHVAEGIVWLGLIVFVVNWARAWLTRDRVRRWLERFAGLAFIGFGVGLAVEPAPR